MSQRSRLAARQRPQSRNSSLRPWRFVTLFAVFLLIQFALLLAPFMRPGVDRFSQWLAHLSGSIIQVCGGSVTMQAAVLRSPVTGFAIEMKDGCNGVNVMILLWSGLLAFPASWIWRAIGLLAGTVLIQSVNLLRFISLYYLGQYSMRWFNFAHEYLWESLIMLDAMVVFGLWVRQGRSWMAAPNDREQVSH